MSGCEEVRDILVAAGRGEEVSAPGQRFLREHVEECPECRRDLANQRMLSAGLSAMAASQPEGPSAAVKTALMAELRCRRVVVPIRRKSTFQWVAIASVAATILMTLVLAQRSRVEKKVTMPALLPVIAVAPPVMQPAVKVADAKAKVQPRRRRPVTRKPVIPVEQPVEVATDFFEIPYAEPLRPEERADVFRMQMPRANMAVFGLPVTGGRLDARVTADVLMGEDGVARAIRFIR